MIRKQKKYDVKYLYHYTKKTNVDKILENEALKTSDDYVFFTGNLTDAITTFENEMMSNNYYIDLDSKLKRRNYASKDDYVILKIPYVEDNNFYEFDFNNNDSIYNKFIVHYGCYEFGKATIINFPTSNNKLVPFLSKCALSLMLFLPYNVCADSWKESGNYNISWYNSSDYSYNISNAEDFAGLSYLVNEENVTFEHKIVNIQNDISLIDHEWETIKGIFKGTIDGAHRIVLRSTNRNLFENNVNQLSLIYNYPINAFLNNTNNYTYIMSNETNTDLKNRLLSLGLYTDNDIIIYNNNLLNNDTDILSTIETNNTFNIYQGFIFLKLNDGTIYGLSCDSSTSIENLKELIEEKINISAEKLLVFYNNVKLENGKTLVDYNIERKSFITIKIKNKVMVNTSENGLTTLDKDYALENEVVNLTIVPNNNYSIKNVKILNSNNEDVSQIVGYNNNKFTMPNFDVKVAVTYEIINPISESASPTDEETTNPNTYDSILVNVVIGLLSLIGILFVSIYGLFKIKKAK